MTGPGGRQIPLARVGGAALACCATPGLYIAEARGRDEHIAVNVGDPQVSNLGAHDSLSAERSGASGHGRRVRPALVALLCVAAAFALALAEWWTWQRRITV